MRLSYSEVIFIPAKNRIGKLIRQGFKGELNEFIEKGPGEEGMKKVVEDYVERLADRIKSWCNSFKLPDFIH